MARPSTKGGRNRGTAIIPRLNERNRPLMRAICTAAGVPSTALIRTRESAIQSWSTSSSTGRGDGNLKPGPQRVEEHGIVERPGEPAGSEADERQTGLVGIVECQEN